MICIITYIFKFDTIIQTSAVLTNENCNNYNDRHEVDQIIVLSYGQ